MRSIYFHEDNFNQIEIIPQENEIFCSIQMTKSDEFTDKHKCDVGWSDVFSLADNPIGIYEKGILVISLENCISQIIPKYDEVYTIFGSQRELCKGIYAYGFDENVVLFYQPKEGIVKYIWLILDIKKEDDIVITLNIFKAIENLGSFILADWGWSFVNKISQTKDIKKYLKERLEMFGSS